MEPIVQKKSLRWYPNSIERERGSALMLRYQRRLVDLLLPSGGSAVTSSSSHSYRSSASPLTLPTVFEPPEDADFEGEAPADHSLPRTIAGLINGQPVPWPPHLESSLSALAPRLTQPAVVRALDLIKPPTAALRFFRWAQSRCRPRVSLDDRAHFKMLQVLCRCRNLSTATDFLLSLHSHTRTAGAGLLHDRFFNALIRAYGGYGRIRESVDLFRRMRDEFGVPPSVFSFNSLLSVLLRRGRTHSARKLFDDMVHPDGGHGAVNPDVCTFNILIRGFCLNSMVEEGFRLFKEMARWGCEPNVLTYNALLDGLCRVGKVRIAHNLLDGMRSKAPDIAPTVVSYTTVIRGYCGKRCIDEAVVLFREMVSAGIKPSSITYNTLIQGLCDAQRMDLIKRIIEEQESGADGGRGFKPDTCTFTTLITAYCNMGCVDGALKVFAKMTEMKVKSDSATYSVLIRALCQKEDFEAAEALLDEVLKKEVLTSRGVAPRLMAAYNPIFEYLCRNGKASKAGKVFHQLLAKGTVDMSSCKTLILGHCREGALRDGYQILVEMVRRDLVPDEETFEALIEGFLGKPDMGFAWKTLERMLNSGHRPKTSTFHSVLAGLLKKDSCIREACDLVAVMLERKIRQSVALSTEVVSSLFRNGADDKAFEILRLLYNNGYGVRMEELFGFVCQSQKFLEARDLLLFCLEQQQSLDVEVYGKVVRGLCQTGSAYDAFRLFYELTEKKVSLASSCLGDLEVALEAEGRLREAQFVSKRTIKEKHVDNN
uniref:Pentatricopeptide repeat-containing protein At1g02060, chloroplastic n=1 Tax=Anthurium amnicola TaxID=1678845 RepID=A0A1D1XLL3_9ARAE